MSRGQRVWTTVPPLALGAAAALPAVWWQPLHLDEAITMSFARRGLGAIVADVFVERGGAPLHFFVEHVTLTWPDGLEGLRLPSVLFFLAALPVAGAVARRLCGGGEGTLLPLLLALAPLGLSLATFARMYSLFVLAVLVATLLALRAAETGGRPYWLTAGVAVGLLVYVHPVAPLYAPLVAATAVAAADRPLRALVREARWGIGAGLAVAAPYGYALAVLRSRYDVGSEGSERLRATAGRSVPEEALHVLTPAGTAGALALLAVTLAGAVVLARRRPRAAAVLVAWLVVPTAFFTLVPASTRFFGRYLAPSEFALYLLVAVALVAAGRAVRSPRVVVAALAGVILGLCAAERFDDLEKARGLGLGAALASMPATPVLLSSTGTPIADRPPELLDDYVDLELPLAARVEELPGIDLRFERGLQTRGLAAVRSFLGGETLGRGAWLLRGPARRVDLALRRLRGRRPLEVQRASPTLLLVATSARLAPRALVRASLVVRAAWTLNAPADRWTTLLLVIERQALVADPRRRGASP